MTYESIGMYPAEDYFSVDPSSGTVSLIRDLKSDPSGLQTYTVRTYIPYHISNNDNFIY